MLETLAHDFAAAMKSVDATRPSHKDYQPGLGPLPEAAVLQLVCDRLAGEHGERYRGLRREVRYPVGRSKCDFVFAQMDGRSVAVEAKLLRFLGDNGKQNGNMLMHVLSPYPQDRSALTDCRKLLDAPIADRRSILIFGYECDDWPLDPALAAFEQLAARQVSIARVADATESGLIHPVHSCCRVTVWEVAPRNL